MKTGLKRNLGASVLAQVLRYGAPLTFYPYLTRVLGADEFAVFALTFSGAMILGQFVEFGFGLMGGRALAEADVNRVSAARTVGDVLAGRLVTCLLVSLAAVVLVPLTLPVVNQNAGLMLALAVLTVSYGASSSWYFIGREKAAQLAGFEVLTSLGQLGLLLALVRPGTPSAHALLLMAVPVVMVSVTGHFLAIRELGVLWPSLRRLRRKLRESSRFFVFTGAMPVLNRAGLLILGSMASPQQVAYYAVGERIVTAAGNMTIPFVRVLMPRITNLLGNDIRAARRLFAAALGGLVGVSFVGAVLGAMSAPWGVSFVFGSEMGAGWPIVAAQLFIVPAAIASRTVGTMAFVPLRLDRMYQRAVLLAGLLSICSAPLAILAGQAFGLAMARLATELCLAVGLWLVLNRVGGAWNERVTTRGLVPTES